MNLTKEEALNLGVKIMEDISFDYDKKDNINVKFDKGEYLIKNKNTWLVSFQYGAEDYGRNVGAHLLILDEDKNPIDISFRNGSITLGYDEEKNKYFIQSKRP
ncbi:hypothetical protein ACM39_02430 [Chryseobacterium sp. FH2]|uniref:hypothetical protein n=1 Tax=Chryseobacterium sp. FH2 TaxID=1674291 RepID=UPI00065AC41E|nr:hypothetical protein [Chryseobacterium sp. FH2]KMQ69918.1 hypothetical protein ACM39_02430 [Chryseobacterium sp. FH2]